MMKSVFAQKRNFALAFFCTVSAVAETPVLTVQADKVTARVNPSLYGLMTEEINYSYDGGLYAELVRNRSFKEDAATPVHWSLLQEGGAGEMVLDPATPLNSAIGTSLKLTVTSAGPKGVGIANEGFWGIPVRPGTRYQASFFAKAAPGFKGPISVSLVSENGQVTHASAKVPSLSVEWKRYEVTLTTAKATPSKDNRLVLSASAPGTVWFSMVSLFPPTYKNRANGNRPDIMQLLADMHPAFLRFPGGNYLEGNTIATRFDWKKTIGPISERPGHMNDGWKYWSSDGMGLLEFLEWCEDLNIKPVLAVYAGYSMRQERVAPGPDLLPYVQDALDEIEYVTGDASTKWGARRVKDGHAKAFPLEYVEIGNEDNFDKQAGSYDGRFTQFFNTIRARYPKLQIVATTKTTVTAPDVIDEHYYRNSEEDMASHSHDYDLEKRPRTGPKVFVGEWATRVGEPTPNMGSAIGDAAWMTNMERNSDLVIMSCYAPLFVNVNKGAMQWKTDLIGYDAMTSYGSPAYWAQQMFSSNHGDQVLSTTFANVPVKEWQPPAPRRAANATEPPAMPPKRQVDTLFSSVTRNGTTGEVFVKLVNRADDPQPVNVQLNGVNTVTPTGQAVTLSAASVSDTNSITEPNKIAPVTAPVTGLSKNFTRTLPPHSITVLKIQTK